MASEILECRQHTWSFRSVTVPSIWPPASLLAGLTMSPMNCTQYKAKIHMLHCATRIHAGLQCTDGHFTGS